jgi:MFS family permease
MGKCNLCYSGLSEGILPACTTACPTGALDYKELTFKKGNEAFLWFPDKNLKPALEFSSRQAVKPLRIIPEHNFVTEYTKQEGKSKNTGSVLSLVFFSYLTTVSIATLISSLINGIFPEKVLFITVLFLAGFLSFFHLGKPIRAWRAVVNLKSSQLSREIALFILYLFVSCTAVILQIPGLVIASSITGIFLLIAIDSVYIYSDRRLPVFMHSGQSFISALLIVSFFTGSILPFTFIALIKIVSLAFSLSFNKLNILIFGLRFFRIALLLITWIVFVAGVGDNDSAIIYLFLTGEFLDRLIFYTDFEPLNINTLIENHLTASENEKERG